MKDEEEKSFSERLTQALYAFKLTLISLYKVKPFELIDDKTFEEQMKELDYLIKILTL